MYDHDWVNQPYIVQLKDRITRLEKFGDMAVHPSEQPRRNNLLYIILDLGGMASIDAR